MRQQVVPTKWTDISSGRVDVADLPVAIIPHDCAVLHYRSELTFVITRARGEGVGRQHASDGEGERIFFRMTARWSTKRQRRPAATAAAPP